MKWSCAAFLIWSWVSFREVSYVFAGQNIQADKAVQDRSLSGKVFTTDKLFDREGLSKTCCAGLCMRTDQCATFTYTQTEGRLCQCSGYRGRKTLSDPNQDSPGTKAYVFDVEGETTPMETTPIETTPQTTAFDTTPVETTPQTTAFETTPVETTPQTTAFETTLFETTPVETTPQTTAFETTPAETTTQTTMETSTAKEDWLETYCVDDNGCSEPNSVCFKGTGCTCTPGFYYSVSDKACLESCTLGDTYIRYELSYMEGHSDEEQSGNLDACKAACSQLPLCLNFDFRRSDSNYCWLSYGNAVTHPDDWKTDSSTKYDNYQRNCE